MKATVTNCRRRADRNYLVVARVFPGGVTVHGVSAVPVSEGQTVNIKDGKVSS